MDQEENDDDTMDNFDLVIECNRQDWSLSQSEGEGEGDLEEREGNCEEWD